MSGPGPLSDACAPSVLDVPRWRRLVVVTVAALVGGLVAGFVGSPPASADDAVPTPVLGIDAPAAVTWPDALLLTGSMTGAILPSGRVVIERQVDAGWKQVATTEVSETGAYSISWVPPKSGQVVLRASWTDPTGTYGSAPVVSSQIQAAVAAASPSVTLVLQPEVTRLGATVEASGVVTAETSGDSEPIQGATITLQRRDGDDWVDAGSDGSGTDETGADGGYQVTLEPPFGTSTYRAVVSAGQAWGEAVSGTSDVSVGKALSDIELSGPAAVRSEHDAVLTVTMTSPTARKTLLADRVLQLQWRRAGDAVWTAGKKFRTGADGVAQVKVHPWRTTKYRAVFAGATKLSATTSPVQRLEAVPMGRVVVLPAKAPSPKKVYPVRRHPVGDGANATVRKLPHDVWVSMQGRTWHPGCKARSTLRYVTVNYWGFDGFRYRGELVVASGVAKSVAGAFSALYRQRFPIRQMQLPDIYGKNPKGPGANDYASMRTDNTSGFNCRYVVGKEKLHVLSPHSTGRAVDVNPWENPYASRTGAFPNRYFLVTRSATGVGLLKKHSPAVRAFTSRGFHWGGHWSSGKDWQHFET